jgi:hypothetical protein
MSIVDKHDRDPAGEAGNGDRPVRRVSVERRDRASRELLLRRIAAEFREMPCLRVTAEQAERLFGLRSDISNRIIAGLVQQGFLRIDEDGKYTVAAG